MYPYKTIISTAWLALMLHLCMCTDDYEYLNRIYSEREARSQNDRFDGLYAVESAFNHLYLTARNGVLSPGPVVLKNFSDSASQLWEVTKFDTSRGYNMKPLANDFNLVTSTLKNNAHSYNGWEFKKSAPGTFIIFNTLNTRCLQTTSINEAVKFEKCQPVNKKQLWKLNKKE